MSQSKVSLAQQKCDIIAYTIMTSAISAFDQYYEMSDGDCWVNQTPEYWYTSMIAKALNEKLDDRNIIMENSVAEIRYNANKRTKGAATKSYRTKGRADISLWTKKWKPRTVIEVKKGWSWDKTRFGPDIGRILASLKETGRASKVGTIENGYFVVITDARDSANETAEDQIKRFKVQAKCKIEEFCKKTGSNFKIKGYFKLGKIVVEVESRMAVLVFKFT